MGVAAVLLVVAALAPLAAQAAACKNFVFIGARGSGEAGTVENDGMGAEVDRMYFDLLSGVFLHGKTINSLPVVYDAAGVDQLKPSGGQLALIATGQLATAAAFYDADNLSPYLQSIDDGTTDIVTEAQTTLRACPKTSLILSGYSQGAIAVHQAELQLSANGQTQILKQIAGTLLLADGGRSHLPARARRLRPAAGRRSSAARTAPSRPTTTTSHRQPA